MLTFFYHCGPVDNSGIRNDVIKNKFPSKINMVDIDNSELSKFKSYLKKRN